MIRELKLSTLPNNWPDKDLLDQWRRNRTTEQIWKILQDQYKPHNGLRSCEPEKIEYYRAMADIMEELGKIFSPI